MGKSYKYLGLGYISAAALFLFNPNIGIVDVLPDLAGYLFLLGGLAKLRYISLSLEAARTGFARLARLSAVKFASIYFVVMMPPNEQPSFMLLLTFGFGVVELIYLMPALRDFFEGISYLASRNGGDKLIALREPGRLDKLRMGISRRLRSGAVSEAGPLGMMRDNSHLRLVYRSTAAFVLAKTVISALPEFASLSSYDYYGYVTRNSFNIAEYTNMFRGLAFIIVLIAGIIWVRKFLRFISLIKKQTAMLGLIEENYRGNILTNDKIFIKKDIKTAFGLIAFALLFAFNLHLGEVDVIPGTAGALLLIFAVFPLLRRSQAKKSTVIAALAAAVMYGAAAAVSVFLSVKFYDNYTLSEVARTIAARDAYRVLSIVSAAEWIIFAITFTIYGILILGVINRHSGTRDMAGQGNTSDFKRRINDDIRSSLRSRVYVSMMISAVLAALNIAYNYWIQFFEATELLCLIWSIVWFAVIVRTLVVIYEQVENRYYFD